MKLQLTAAFAALTVAAFANGASAAEPVVAKLAAAGSAQKPVAGGAVFDCLGDVCAARTPSSDTATVRGCKELVRQVGAVSAFGPNSKPFSADQLTACNASARK